MVHRKLIATLAGIGVAAVAAGAAGAADSAVAPSKVTIKQSTSFKFVPNRYIQDGLRWEKDVYRVKSGGTIHVVNSQAGEGPHTFTVVARKDLPRRSLNCPTCDKLTKAHGADPHSDAPPKFNFLENGVGQSTAPSVDRPGDSGVTGSGKKGEFIDMKVTAKAGTTLYFLCLVHPWMQSELQVK